MMRDYEKLKENHKNNVIFIMQLTLFIGIIHN